MLNSATAAEELNLRALGVREGDEIIVPAYSYTASASAAIHCGAKVVFVDIQKDGDSTTHCPEMDYEKIFEIVERKKGLFKPMDDHSNPLTDLGSRIKRDLVESLLCVMPPMLLEQAG